MTISLLFPVLLFVVIQPSTISAQGTMSPTRAPTASAIASPTRSPTRAPTASAIATPTRSPTRAPTASAIATPTRSPTRAPTASAIATPTRSPTKPPTASPIASPTRSPTKPPTASPIASPTRSPTIPTLLRTNAPTVSTNCICDSPKHIPSECEVKTLIELMDIAVKGNHKLSPQWLRLAFHDAGTFNIAVPEGGANGCLMTHPEMRHEPENANLDIAIETLKTIRDNWELLKNTCINVSNADIIQFAGFFASVRQTGNVPGITDNKKTQLLSFQWGRPDETRCQTAWTANLPGFSLGADPKNLAQRCMMSGQEIKLKMIDRNGFTAEEATALIGAHTIGLLRNVFGSGFAGPWVENGGDSATSTGPVFDNTYFSFMTDNIVAKSTSAFAINLSPFTQNFPDWVRRDGAPALNFLDTDLVLAFPPASSTHHPNYHTSTVAFSRDNQLFLDTFQRALSKMGKLGVVAKLGAPVSCSSCTGFEDPITTDEVIKVVTDLGGAVATADSSIIATQLATEDVRVVQTTPVV